MRSLALITILLLAISPMQVMQAAEPAAELADQVLELVDQLNADALSERTTAEQALIKLGAQAIEFLPEPDDRTPPEVAQRLARVRQALEQAQASATSQPTLVTIVGQDFPLDDVIKQISKQTGNKIVDHREAFGEEVTEPRLAFNMEKIPFWQAVDEVLDKADLTLYDYAGESGLYLINRLPNQIARKDQVCYAGPFRIEGVRFEAMNELRQPKNRALRLFINIAWEPRLLPIAIRQPLNEIKAVGSDGSAIELAGTDGVPEAAVSNDSSSAELQIPLQLPPRNIEKIASLKGKLQVMVPGPMQSFRFDKLPIVGGDGKANAKPEKVELRKAGVTVTVDQVRKNSDVWEVRTRVKFDKPGDSLDSFRSWILRNKIYLVDADQKQITPDGFEQTRHTENEVGMAYMFDLAKGPQGMTLVYETPAIIFELPVEYELRDLLLP